jgi:hypothetical protein
MPPRVEVDHICVKLILLPGDPYFYLNNKSLTMPVTQIIEGYDSDEEVTFISF